MAPSDSVKSDHRKFHIAFAVGDIAASVLEYNEKLGCEPELVIENEYALWRTDALNFSIRASDEKPGFRHVGWEDSEAPGSTEVVDSNGVVWERFSSSQQLAEIRALWPPDVN